MESASPEAVGLSATRLQRLRHVMQQHIDRQQVAGVHLTIARRGYVAYQEGFGLMDVEAQKPMRPDTICRIYSMTKPVTSVAMMMLYEDGCFQLDEPVSHFIPAFKDVRVFAGGTANDYDTTALERDITIRHLMTHTGGLSYGRMDDTPVDELYRQAELLYTTHLRLLNPDLTLAEMVARLVRLPLVHQPGTMWRYSLSTDVLARLVEIISGRPFDRFLQERIFGPLGMIDTSHHLPPEKRSRYAALYGGLAGGGLELIDPAGGDLYTVPPCGLTLGGSGLVSTANDYLRFAQMLLNGGELEGVRLLSRKTVALMTRHHVSEEVLRRSAPVPGNGLGLGFNVTTDVVAQGIIGSEGTFSAGGAAGTLCWVDPAEEMIGLLMVQIFTPQVNLHHDFRVLAYQAIAD